MPDDRDITDRLEDPSYDGAIDMRQDAAKQIRALRHYVARLENDLAREEYEHGSTIFKLEKARGHIFDQALDYFNEVGRLREALENLLDEQNGPPLIGHAASWQAAIDQARAALAEKEKK